MNIRLTYRLARKSFSDRWVSEDCRISFSISDSHEVALTEVIKTMAPSREAPLNLISASLIVMQRYVDRLRENMRNQQYPEAQSSPGSPGPLARPPTSVPEPVGERYNRRVPQDVKIAVSARDGGRCRRCGSTKQLHFDHVIPVSRGGANTVANIQLLCGTCNREKGAEMLLRSSQAPGRSVDRRSRQMGAGCRRLQYVSNVEFSRPDR